MKLKTVCVFCGSGLGSDPLFREEAAMLGKLLADRGISLVFGGGKVGIMGVLANNVLMNGGTCIGVMPRNIVELEIAHTNLSELHIVDNILQRKSLMAEISDAFIAFPGGLGTLDELTEMLTHNQLRIFDKPIGLLNVNGYFDHLLAFFDHAVSNGFIRHEHRNNLAVSGNAEELLKELVHFKPVHIDGWISDILSESSHGSQDLHSGSDNKKKRP